MLLFFFKFLFKAEINPQNVVHFPHVYCHEFILQRGGAYITVNIVMYLQTLPEAGIRTSVLFILN